MRKGANQAGRDLGDDFHTSVMTYSSILRPGETLKSDRVIDEIGAEIVSSLHFWYELYLQRGSEDFILKPVHGVWQDYKRYVESEMPLERRHQMLHRGHCAFLLPQERRFVTPELIRATSALVGEADEILERIGELEKAGLKEIVLLPPHAVARQNFREFSEQIMSRY
jgi:hypothetical protein